MEGLIHRVPGLLPFSPRPPELAQAPATSLRQRSLGRSNINFPPGSNSALLGLRAQGPSSVHGCEPPPPATVLLRAPPPLGQPRPHLFLPPPGTCSPLPAKAPSNGQGKSCKQNELLARQLQPCAWVSVGPLPGVSKRGSAPPSQSEVLRSFSKSPKICPSSSRCACSSPGLVHTLSPGTPKCPPPGLCLSLRFLCSAQAAQERTLPIHTDLQQPRALGDPVRCPPDLDTHTPTLSDQQVARGLPCLAVPCPARSLRAQGRHAHQARGWPSRASVARGLRCKLCSLTVFFRATIFSSFLAILSSSSSRPMLVLDVRRS